MLPTNEILLVHVLIKPMIEHVSNPQRSNLHSNDYPNLLRFLIVFSTYGKFPAHSFLTHELNYSQSSEWFFLGSFRVASLFSQLNKKNCLPYSCFMVVEI